MPFKKLKINLTLKPNFFFLLLLWSLGCVSPEAQKPLNKQDTYFLQQSAQRNKQLLSAEQNLMQKVMENEKATPYLASKKGFWYRYKNKIEPSTYRPKKGDRVQFRYSIATLDGKMLYNEETLGSVSYLVDQEDLVPALREGVKIMQAGEVVVFLFPSYLCFSYQGDGDKIGINQPLRFEISLDTIIKIQTQ